VWRFGLNSGRVGDKFVGLTTHTGPGGCPVLADAVGWLECRVETKLDIGDRTLYLAEVHDGKVTNFMPPLTLKRLIELAPPEKLATLKRLRHYDSNHDTEAILAWRAQNGAGSPVCRTP
jgi:flavin reductase (DIM6/NTAB) family NADH-FMN oxidoreductase RutF